MYVNRVEGFVNPSSARFRWRSSRSYRQRDLRSGCLHRPPGFL